MEIEKKEQNGKPNATPTIRDLWLSDFMSQIDEEHFNVKFERPLICLMDEYRKGGDHGVYNTSRKLVAKQNLAHLNVQAKSGDEYGSAATERLIVAHKGYLRIVQVLAQRVRDCDRKDIFNSVPLFTFLMRDFLTNEHDRVIEDEPLIAAAKLAFSPYELSRRLGGTGVHSAERLMDYIQKRMAAKVTSELAQLCHEILPAEAEKCGLPKEPVTGEWVGKVELLYSLEVLDLDCLDLSYVSDLVELREIIIFIESLIDDGQVFYFGTDERLEDGYYVLRETENGKFYRQHIQSCDFFFNCYGVELLEDEGLIAAILDTGISPVMLTERELKECGLAA